MPRRESRGMDLAWVFFVLVILAGGAVAAQAGVNATLARGVGGPVHAALISFSVGTLALAAVALARRADLPTASAFAALPWWAWVGGLLGAVYVTIAVMAAPRLGAGALVAGTIAGQLIAALAIDHFGWVGFAERAATLPRILGVGLLVAGAALVRFG